MSKIKHLFWVFILVVAALMLMGAGAMVRDRFDWVITKRLTVQYGGADFYSDIDMNGLVLQDIGDTGTDFNTNGGLTLAEDLEAVDGSFSDDLTVTDDATITDDAAVGGDLTVSGNITNRALAIRYQDVANDDADNVYSAAAVISTTTVVSTSITNPDYPRNVVLSYQTTTTATALSLTVAGVNARGSSTSEVIAVGAVSGTQTLTGNMPWASITSFTWSVTRTEAVTFSVGLGEKLGLPVIPVAAGDVFFVTENNAYITAYTVNTTYGTVLPTADIVANDDFTIWVRQ